jgi:class 3 adenylate cyclase
MFTDIVGSTVLLSEMGDERWAEVLRWHDSMLRRMFIQYAGREVKQVGDGFFAVFEDAYDSLVCALEIQRRMACFEWVNAIALRTRIGVHRADVIQIDNDYMGRGVHEAARIAASANEGEVLTSLGTLAASCFAFKAQQPRRVTLRGLPEPLTVVSLGQTSRRDQPEPVRQSELIGA